MHLSIRPEIYIRVLLVFNATRRGLSAENGFRGVLELLVVRGKACKTADHAITQYQEVVVGTFEWTSTTHCDDRQLCS